MTKAFLGLGSNLGDRCQTLVQAIEALALCPGIELLRRSSFYETEPFGYKEQSAFINAVVEIATELEPMALLRVCQQIEAQLGRKRNIHWGPRTIDIDILLFGSLVMETEDLKLPHPYLAQRRFVLLPLAELTDAPVLGGASAAELLVRCQDEGAVVPCKEQWRGGKQTGKAGR